MGVVADSLPNIGPAAHRDQKHEYPLLGDGERQPRDEPLERKLAGTAAVLDPLFECSIAQESILHGLIIAALQIDPCRDPIRPVTARRRREYP